MRKLIITIVILLLACSARAFEPTLADARADVDAARYSMALTKITRLLTGSATKPGAPQRYDLFMLRGECMLRTRTSAEAAEAFSGALREVDFASEPNRASEARAMVILTKASPRQVYRPSPDAPPIDIVALDSRKKAMAVLFEQRFAEAEPKIREAINSSSLLPTKLLLPALGDLYAIELVSTGDVVRTRAAIQAFDEHARQLLDAELERIGRRVDDLNRTANEAVLSDNPHPFLSYRGLASPERDQLRELAGTLVEIDKVIRDGEGINKSIGSDTQAWETLKQRCSNIKATAEHAYTRSY
jgi:hypothetical protein